MMNEWSEHSDRLPGLCTGWSLLERNPLMALAQRITSTNVSLFLYKLEILGKFSVIKKDSVCACVTRHLKVPVQASLSLMRTTTNRGRGVSVWQMASSLMFHQWSWSGVLSGGRWEETAPLTQSGAATHLMAANNDPARRVRRTTDEVKTRQTRGRI